MQKHRKFNPKKRPQHGKTKPKENGNKKSKEKPSWKPVKISGPVIADDGADFGGFIGLEVMENYGGLVKKKKVEYDEDMEFGNKKKKSKRKRAASDSDESETEMEVYSREKSLKVPKLTKSAFLETTEDDSGSDDAPKKKKTVEKPDSKKLDAVEKVGSKEPAKLSSKGKETSLKPRETVKLENELKSKQNGVTKPKVDEEEAEPAKPFSMLLKPPKQKEKMKKQFVKKQDTKAEAQQSFSSVDYASWVELGVSEPIVKALADKGFKVPTEIQLKSLPVAILGCRDLLGAAETGSGKTLAFGIPMLEGIMKLKQQDEPPTSGEDHRSSDHELTPPPEDMEDLPEDVQRVFATEGSKLQGNPADPNKPLYGLILTPTRELAVQINDHLKAVAKYTGINIATVFGGLAAVKQERLLRKCPEIVIATPGRLWELIQGGNAHLSKVAQIRFLVIDETDRMLEKGHFDELKQLLELINSNEEAKNRRRNYIFSATLTMDHDLPEHLMKNAKTAKKVIKETPGMRMNNLIQVVGMTDPKIVDLTQEHGTAHTLTESRIVCTAEQKDYFLYYFLDRHPGRTLVFCNSIDCVKRLVSLLEYLNCSPLSLFGSMQQRQRLKNLERFTANPKALLVATDVAARGLDIPNVDHVIHYQVPKTTENYVHRSGRTARASREGLALLLISPAEMKDYVKLNQNLGRSEDLPLYPTSDRMMRQIKLRVNLAREIERMDLQQLRTGAERSWQDKLEQEFQSDSDVDSEQEEMRKIEQSKWKRGFKAKRMELSKMLATPLVMERKVEMRFPTSHLGLTPTQDAGKSAINLVREAEQERIAASKRRGKKKRN